MSIRYPSLICAPFMTLAALACSARTIARRGNRAVSHGDIAWLLFPAAVLLFLSLWGALNLYMSRVRTMGVTCLVIYAAGVIALMRTRVFTAYTRFAQRRSISLRRVKLYSDIGALVIGAALGTLAIEFPYNDFVFQIALGYAFLEWIHVFAVLLFFYFVGQRSGVAIVVGVTVFFLIGLIQYFVVKFRGTAFFPSDLLVLSTALSVSGNYVYSIEAKTLYGIWTVFAAHAVGALVIPDSLCDAFESKESSSSSQNSKLFSQSTSSVFSSQTSSQGNASSSHKLLTRRSFINLAGASATAAAFLGAITQINYMETFAMYVNYWWPINSYRQQGMVPTFIAIAQEMKLTEPEGYTEEGALDLEEAYVRTYDTGRALSDERLAAEQQFSDIQPSVVVIVNETFSDLSLYEGESWGYTGPQFFKSLDDALFTGNTMVSVIGGGTCDTEFEFLTGVSLAYLGGEKHPFTLFNLESAPSVPKHFSELGYTTVAMHPNRPGNWNRTNAYGELGFDRFLSIEDFEGAPTFHSGVSDAATYDKILELLRQDDSPQFIYDLTMQNHSDYDQDNIDPSLLGNYEISGLSEYDNGRLNEYLACIEVSDRDLEEFLSEVSALERPVLVVFFGDHQPSFGTIVNSAVYSTEEEDDLKNTLRPYTSVYAMWANYDVAGNGQIGEHDDSCPAFLAAQALEALGAPLTDFQKAQLAFREQISAMSLMGTRFADGTEITRDDSASYSEAWCDMEKITYLEFGSKL